MGRNRNGMRYLRIVTPAVVALVLLLAPAASHAAYPLSPNGKIAYERDDGTGDDLWTMNPDGSGQAPLITSPDPTREYEPAWSPTGNQIAFVRAVPGNSDVYIANAD